MNDVILMYIVKDSPDSMVGDGNRRKNERLLSTVSFPSLQEE